MPELESIIGRKKMLNFDFTFVFTIVNILFLFWILKMILFKPATKFMENRVNSIKDAIETAQENKEQSEALKAELKEQLDKAVDEAGKIVSEAKAKAGKQYDEILVKAKEDAKALVAKAQKEIEIERANMLNELKAQIAGIALTAASRVVQKNMDSETNKKLVEQFIDEVGAA